MGPHLLAPTGASAVRIEMPSARLANNGLMPGSDLTRYNAAGTVFAGFHYGV